MNEVVRVESSVIDSIEYNNHEEELIVNFHNGSAYQYVSVSEETFRDFLKAPSQGQYFNQYIKHNYKFYRLN